MKRKLPSYTLKAALVAVNPCATKFTLEYVKKMFPGKRKITARDVLKAPIEKFRSPFTMFATAGENKIYAAGRLIPVELHNHWNWENLTRAKTQVHIKRCLELCDMYEQGEI